MWKASHWHLAKQLADVFGFSKLSTLEFCLGSVFPDFKPSFISNFHSYENWISWYEQHKKTCKGYFMLGELSHFCADFFVYFHSCEKSIGRQHFCWERDLNKYIMQSNLDCNIKKISDIKKVHSQYMISKPSVYNDYEYIISSVFSLLLLFGFKPKSSIYYMDNLVCQESA